jgi:hypothetical protein
MSQDRKFVGSGKEVAGYDLVNVTLKKSDLDNNYFNYNGQEYIKLTVGKKREADQYGKTHAVWLNEYKPEGQEEKAQAKPVSGGDGLPF